MIRKIYILFLLLSLCSSVCTADPNVDGKIDPNDEYSGANHEQIEGSFGYMETKYVSGTGLFLCNCWCKLDESIEEDPDNSYNKFPWIYDSNNWMATIYYEVIGPNDPNKVPNVLVETAPTGDPNNWTKVFDSKDPNDYDPNNPDASDYKFAVGWDDCEHANAILDYHYLWELLIPEDNLTDPNDPPPYPPIINPCDPKVPLTDPNLIELARQQCSQLLSSFGLAPYVNLGSTSTYPGFPGNSGCK